MKKQEEKESQIKLKRSNTINANKFILKSKAMFDPSIKDSIIIIDEVIGTPVLHKKAKKKEKDQTTEVKWKQEFEAKQSVFGKRIKQAYEHRFSGNGISLEDENDKLSLLVKAIEELSLSKGKKMTNSKDDSSSAGKIANSNCY